MRLFFKSIIVTLECACFLVAAFFLILGVDAYMTMRNEDFTYCTTKW